MGDLEDFIRHRDVLISFNKTLDDITSEESDITDVAYAIQDRAEETMEAISYILQELRVRQDVASSVSAKYAGARARLGQLEKKSKRSGVKVWVIASSLRASKDTLMRAYGADLNANFIFFSEADAHQKMSLIANTEYKVYAGYLKVFKNKE